MIDCKRIILVVILIFSILLFGCSKQIKDTTQYDLPLEEYWRIGIPVGAPEISEVQLETDKVVYTQAELIKLTITNNFDKNISFRENQGANLLGAGLRKFSNGDWIASTIYGDWCPCGMECEPIINGIDLAPKQEIEKTWNQEIKIAKCNLFKAGFVDSYENRLKEPGKYKFLLIFGFYEDEVLKDGFSYSNEFEIR